MRNSTIVVITCVAVLAIRLLLASQATTFAPEAYGTIRQAEHIVETGVPYATDPLTPEGEPQPVLPVFPYLVAFGTILFGSYAYTLVPNLLATLLHAAIFWLVIELTQHRGIATTAMLASVAVPGYLVATLHTVSPLALAFPLIVVVLTLFIKLRKSKEKRNILLGLTVLLLATHAIGLILIPVFILALAFGTIRRTRDLTIQYEYAIFVTFLSVWAYMLLFKTQLAERGFGAVYGTIPAALVPSLYGSPDLMTFGIAVGAVPFGLAIYAAYKEGAAEHPGAQATVAFGIVAFLATAFRIVPTATGVTLVAIACVILAAIGIEWLMGYLATMRKTPLPRILATIGVTAFVITSVIPSAITGVAAAARTVPDELVENGTWLTTNSLPDATVLTQPAWQQALAWASGRPVLTGDTDRFHDDANAILEGREPQAAVIGGRRIEYLLTEDTLTHRCVNHIRGERVRLYKVLC